MPIGAGLVLREEADAVPITGQPINQARSLDSEEEV